MPDLLGIAPRPCPGGCGRTIDNVLVSCPPCFERLPASHRAELLSAVLPGNRNVALQRARAWLAEHPAGVTDGVE
jgi:hypothetical protein